MRRIAILLLLTASICWGQAATLMTIPHQHWHDSDGTLCAACTVTTYTAGTSTPTATYTSKTGLVTNANPITLNARGEPTSDGSSVSSIFIKAGTCLKLELKSSAGVTISTEDNICSDPAAPASLTSNNAGYGWTLTQQNASGGGVNIVPGANSGTGQEAFRIRNAANNVTEVQCWGNGNCTLAGTIQAAIGTITGNATVGGTLGVTGLSTLATAKIGTSGSTILKHLTFSLATVNFPVQAANTCTDSASITATGVAAGDSLVLTPPADNMVANVSWSVYVSAADTIKIRLCNVATSASADPPSSTFRLDVWQH